MSKNKNTKSIVITILITVIVLGCLTFAAMQFLVPAYMNANEGQSSLKNKIYETAVKVFPLLVGIVLIVIASMIANSRNEEEVEVDEEDKLPPNSYDKQMFEAPSDDPSAAKSAAAPADKAPEQKKESFFEIFESHEKPAEPVQEEPQPVAAAEPVEEQPAEPEPVPEPEPEPEAEPVIVPSAPVAPAAPATDAPVVEAIYALIRKLDNLTDLMSVEEEVDEEEEADDQADYEYYADQEQEEQEEPEDKSEQGEERISHIEDKLDKLCEVVGNLAAAISAQSFAAPPKAEKPVKHVTEVKKVEVPVEVPVDKKLNDINPEDPLQRARIEFDSAKECFYDITFAFTDASVEKARKALPESAYVLKINGKTVVIVPFLDKAEAESELDRIGAKYDSVFVSADDHASFDEVVSHRI